MWYLVCVYITRRCVNVLIGFLASPNYYTPICELNDSLGYIKRVYVYITGRCVNVQISSVGLYYTPICELNDSLAGLHTKEGGTLEFPPPPINQIELLLQCHQY